MCFDCEKFCIRSMHDNEILCNAGLILGFSNDNTGKYFVSLLSEDRLQSPWWNLQKAVQ